MAAGPLSLALDGGGKPMALLNAVVRDKIANTPLEKYLLSSFLL